METISSSCQATLPPRNNTYKTEKKLLTESEEKGMMESITDTRLENDVLRMRIKRTEKSNEILTCLKNEEIIDLKSINEQQNIKIGDQADKIHQLDTSNIKKDSQIEGMKKRMKEMEKQLEDFLEQKDKLEQHILEMKVMNDKSIKEKASQGEKIQNLESELEEVKKELKSIRSQKESFETCIKIAQEKQTEQLQRMLRETVEETIKETMKEELAKMLPTVEPRKEPSPAPGGTEFHMKDIRSVQINVHSENSRNIVSQTSRSISNRRVVKPLEFNMPFPK